MVRKHAFFRQLTIFPTGGKKGANNHLYVVGNGPSAITLSYMLAGNVPYYVGNSSDEFLHLRLSENADEPLVLQDLAFLSDVSTLSVLDFLGT